MVNIYYFFLGRYFPVYVRPAQICLDKEMNWKLVRNFIAFNYVYATVISSN